MYYLLPVISLYLGQCTAAAATSDLQEIELPLKYFVATSKRCSAKVPRFEYDLLAKFLIEQRGYDGSIKVQSFDSEVDFVCKVG